MKWRRLDTGTDYNTQDRKCRMKRNYEKFITDMIRYVSSAESPDYIIQQIISIFVKIWIPTGIYF